MSFFGDQVDDDGASTALDRFECGQQGRQIVSVFDKHIIEAQHFKEIGLRRSVCIAQFFQVLVQSAMVFGNRHIVVVDDDNHIRSQNSGVVQRFQRFAARQRPVAHNRDNVIIFAFQIAGFRQTVRQARPRGGVSDLEKVVFAFVRIRKAGNAVVFRGIKEVFFASRQNFVRVALMRHVENDFVLGRIKNGVKRNRCFQKSQVRPHVSARFIDFFNQNGANVIRQSFQFGNGQ